MSRHRFILLITTLLISCIMLAGCSSGNMDQPDGSIQYPGPEIAIESVDIPEAVPIQTDKEPLTENKAAEPYDAEALIGRWQTEDGAFKYDVLESGQLLVESQYGVDENCSWHIDDNTLVFYYSDSGTAWFTYNSENDTLDSSGAPESWSLVRS